MEFSLWRPGGRTLTAIVRAAAGVSHRQARALIERGGVRVDGRVAEDPVLRPRDGAQISIGEASGRGRKTALRGPGFRVVVLDDALIAVDKEPGVVVIPTTEGDEDDPPLVSRVGAALQLAGHRVDRLWVVHRIDRATSGLVLLARSGQASERLRAGFRQRSVLREYLGWVSGRPEPGFARIETGLVEDPRTHRVEVGDGPGSKPAVLDYAVQQSRPDRTASRVKVRLVTGRRNQIRAQYAHFGWPLLGDGWYGGPRDRIERAALHAHRLRFEHPFTRQEMLLEAPLPADLQALDRRLFG